MAETFLIGDVAKRLNVPLHRVSYLFTTRRVPEPQRLGNRRIFSHLDARRVAKALGLAWEPEKMEAHE